MTLLEIGLKRKYLILTHLFTLIVISFSNHTNSKIVIVVGYNGEHPATKMFFFAKKIILHKDFKCEYTLHNTGNSHGKEI